MKRRWFLPSVAALALMLIAGLWLHDVVRPAPLNVIFLTVESWRAGSATPELMPNLLSAARQGTRFTKHHAISAWTAPNIIAVLSGLSPFEQGVHARGQSVSPNHRLLLEELAEQGWQVAGLQSFMTIDVFRNLGLTITPIEEPMPWLAARARDGRPFVLWYHYLKTHLPYAPSPRFRAAYEALTRNLDSVARDRMAVVASAPVIPAGTLAFEPSDAPAVRALYRGGVAEFDAWFGSFWDFFNRSGLKDSTILIVTADHGEELLERGNVGHASTTRAGHLHEEIVSIPLFVWLPARDTGAEVPRVIDRNTDHLFIEPTLRNLLARNSANKGEPSLFDESAYDGPLMAATSYGGYAEPDPHSPSGFEAAIYDGEWKLRLRQDAGGVVTPWLHDLRIDPGEHHNLAEHESAQVRAMSRILLPKMHILWTPQDKDTVENASLAVFRPAWISPSSGGVLRYADVAEGARLEWTGDPAGDYVVEYQAGAGTLKIEGALDVTGTVKDFGRVGESYWRTWIVPYGQVRLRVVPAGREDLASAWIEMTVES